VVILIALLAYACNSRQKSNSESDKRNHIDSIHSFKPPYVILLPKNDTGKAFNTNSISLTYPRIFGKHKIQDTLILNTESVNYYKVDDPYECTRNEGINKEGFSTDGLEIFPDYNSRLQIIPKKEKNLYYPVYIVNRTPDIKLFHGRYDYIYALQEAQDKDGCWWPIECKGLEFCGVALWATRLHPQEMLVTLFPKYEGTFKTKLRVRIVNGGTIYVSQPFEGTINRSQFLFDKSSYCYKLYHSDNQFSRTAAFMGIIPKEEIVKNRNK
jgi:hypothetical protein